MWRFDFSQFEHDPRFGGFVRRMPVRPSWPLGVAVALGLLVVVVPLVLLALAGLVVGVVTFVLLRLVQRAIDALSSLTSSGDRAAPSAGRRNVRVIETRD